MEENTKTKIGKVIRGALIAGGGVALTYFLQAISTMDFGTYSAIVAGVCAIIINAIKEGIKKYD